MRFLEQFSRRALLILLVGLSTGLAGCRSTMGLFFPVDHHPELLGEARAAIQADDIRRVDSLMQALDKRTAESSRMLYLLESARLMSLAGDTRNSVELYREAEERFDTERIRASFTASESLQKALAVVTNDRAIPYNGQLFEQLLVYYFQALNYLDLGDSTAARIELNKALRDMRWGKENLPQLRRQSDQSLAQSGIQGSGFPEGFSDPPDGLVLESSSDNALIYYLSGLIFEAGGDLNRAEVDYRNALAYAPGSKPVQSALAGLGQEDAETGRLVIVHESDWVSPKFPFSFPVFFKNRSYTLSFPYYADNYWSSYIPESFVRIGDSAPLLSPILNVDATVRKALEEQFSAILVRQALRMFAKDQIQDEVEEADPWLGLAASIFAILSDSPDLRSWLSLPATVYLADLRLPVGTYPVRTDMGKGGAEPVILSAGEITLLHIVTAQGSVISVDSFPILPYRPLQ